MCALLAKIALVGLLKLPFRMICVILRTFGDLLACDMVDEDAIRVPMFYAAPIESHQLLWMSLTIYGGMLFGGIHCAGWDFPFPSHAELIIWRVSSFIILMFPCTFVCVIGVEDLVWDMNINATINIYVFGLGIVIYVLARLTLFVEAFIALRHLPPGAYAAVKWTALLLHM